MLRMTAVQVDRSSSSIPELTLARRLLLARDEAGQTQKEWAETIGVSKRSIVNYENGATSPSRPVLLSWAMASGVDLDWLAGSTPCPSCGLPTAPGHQGQQPTDTRSRCFCPSDQVSDDQLSFFAFVDRQLAA